MKFVKVFHKIIACNFNTRLVRTVATSVEKDAVGDHTYSLEESDYKRFIELLMSKNQYRGRKIEGQKLAVLDFKRFKDGVEIKFREGEKEFFKFDSESAYTFHPGGSAVNHLSSLYATNEILKEHLNLERDVPLSKGRVIAEKDGMLREELIKMRRKGKLEFEFIEGTARKSLVMKCPSLQGTDHQVILLVPSARPKDDSETAQFQDFSRDGSLTLCTEDSKSKIFEAVLSQDWPVNFDVVLGSIQVLNMESVANSEVGPETTEGLERALHAADMVTLNLDEANRAFGNRAVDMNDYEVEVVSDRKEEFEVLMKNPKEYPQKAILAAKKFFSLSENKSSTTLIITHADKPPMAFQLQGEKLILTTPSIYTEEEALCDMGREASARSSTGCGDAFAAAMKSFKLLGLDYIPLQKRLFLSSVIATIHYTYPESNLASIDIDRVVSALSKVEGRLDLKG